jgi:hypothetical protein
MTIPGLITHRLDVGCHIQGLLQGSYAYHYAKLDNDLLGTEVLLVFLGLYKLVFPCQGHFPPFFERILGCSSIYEQLLHPVVYLL